jgi:hypothetical protein
LHLVVTSHMKGSIVSTVPASGKDVYSRRAQVSLYIILCCCDQAGNAAQATSAAWVETFALSERTPSFTCKVCPTGGTSDPGDWPMTEGLGRQKGGTVDCSHIELRLGSSRQSLSNSSITCHCPGFHLNGKAITRAIPLMRLSYKKFAKISSQPH